MLSFMLFNCMPFIVLLRLYLYNVDRSDTEDEKSYKTWKKSIMLVWRAAANHKLASPSIGVFSFFRNVILFGFGIWYGFLSVFFGMSFMDCSIWHVFCKILLSTIQYY